MLRRTKRAIVDSYIGAVALGYMLAQAFIYLMYMFVSPFSAWLSQGYFKDISPRVTPLDLPLYDALVELARFIALILLWYALLYWLYMKPVTAEKSEPARQSE